MSPAAKPPLAGRARRRWCISPALFRDRNDPALPEGAAILDDVRGNLGLLLWQLYRDVLLWAQAGPDARCELFSPGAYETRLQAVHDCSPPAQTRKPIECLSTILRSDNGPDPRSVARCCRRLAEWAAASGHAHTAVAFTLLAAASEPAAPGAAVEVGRAALRFGRLDIAETWLRRAVGLSRRSEEWGSYSEAYLHLGEVAAARGDLARARVRYLRALRTARRGGFRSTRGLACHGLLRLALAAADFESASRFAKAARAALGETHPVSPALLHDVADLMRRRQEEPEQVIAVLRGILPTRRDPEDRVSTLMLLLRAAADAGDREVLADAWFDAVDTIRRMGEGAGMARRLLELAMAAAEVGEPVRADRTAREALDVATRMDCPAVAHDADRFLRRTVPRPEDRAGHPS